MKCQLSVPFCLSLILISFLCTSVRAQERNAVMAQPAANRTATWGQALIGGRHDNFTVTPSGQLWCSTATGHLWHADSLNGNWADRYFGEDDYDGEHFQQTNFFNDSVGILTGYLHDDDYNDHLYRTTNGGKNWTRQPIAKGKWIDAAVALPTGHAWLASSDQVMYRSADAGATWKEISRPENKTNQRITELSFLDPNNGIAGTGWNRLYLTANGGDTWRIIPTPLDQKLYTPTSKSHRPSIDGVLFSPQTLFVTQNGTWFYTPTSETQWRSLSPGTEVYGYDLTQDQLFAGRADTILTTTGAFNGAFTSTDAVRDIPGKSATVANGKLYFLGYQASAVYDGETYQSYRNYGHEIPITDIEYDGHKGKVNWGHLGTEIYQKTPPSGNWHRFALLNENIEAISPLSDESAKVRTVKGNYVLHSNDLSLKPFHLRDSLQLPSLSEIKKITIEKSSQGCFHSDQDIREFVPTQNEFRERKGRGVITHAEVAELLNHLLEDLAPTRLKALPLAPSAYGLFEEMVQAAILEKKKAKRHDRPRLDHLSETSHLYEYPDLPSSERLIDAFQLAISGERGWSTTTNAIKITFSFRSGPPVELYYQYSYSEPNYLVWQMTYGDAALAIPSGLIRSFYLNQLKDEDRVAADAELLFQLAVLRAGRE
jgi:hypothetical protein